MDTHSAEVTNIADIACEGGRVGGRAVGTLYSWRAFVDWLELLAIQTKETLVGVG